MGTQIPKWGDQGPNLRQCSLSEYQVQIKFQMFTITSAVPSDIPLLASSKQQRFAMDNQDVLPQGPVQPAHGPVGPHSGQPPPLWHNSFHSKKCCSSPSKECCSMCLQHQAWNQWHCSQYFLTNINHSKWTMLWPSSRQNLDWWRDCLQEHHLVVFGG